MLYLYEVKGDDSRAFYYAANEGEAAEQYEKEFRVRAREMTRVWASNRDLRFRGYVNTEEK